MRALIVDDQHVSRMKVQKIMESFCQADAVDCGQAAIDAFEKALATDAPYDLVTLDISMPDMDGRRVLQIMRKLEILNEISKERRAKILMITSSSDRDTVITSIQSGCDDYLVKPLNKEAISGKLKKFGLIVAEESASEKTIRQMIDTSIERFKIGQLDLPSMPQIIFEIETLMDHPDADVAAIAAAVEKDPSVAVNVVAISNSPLYRGHEKVQSVQAAISRIGLKEIRQIVTVIAGKGFYQCKNSQIKELLDQLWRHSLACAHAARLLAEKTGRADAQKSFMGGLIHDIGSVLLLKSLGDVALTGVTLDRVELINSLYEVHTDFGAMLLNKWSFSKDLIKICKLHEWSKFNPATETEILIVNLADHLIHKINYGFFEKRPIELVDLDSSKLLGVGTETLDSVATEVTEVMTNSVNLF